jgi:hypothetical protein
MAKPAITKRAVKAAALTYAELDTNFQNLADATITLTAGTGGTAVIADLNGNITLVAGTNITLTGNNTAKTLTINSTGGGSSLDTDTITVGESDADTVTIQAVQSQDKAIILKAGLNSSPSLANYIKINAPGAIELRSAGITVGNSTGNAGITFTDNTWSIASTLFKTSGDARLQDSSSNNTNITLTANEVSVKGPFKLEQYTTTQRNALTAANGHLIYNTTDHKFQGYANGSWVDLH